MQKVPVNWNAVKDTVIKAAKIYNKRFIKARNVIDVLEENPRIRCNELKDIPEKTEKNRINKVLRDLFHRHNSHGGNGGGVYIVPWVEA